MTIAVFLLVAFLLLVAGGSFAAWGVERGRSSFVRRRLARVEKEYQGRVQLYEEEARRLTAAIMTTQEQARRAQKDAEFQVHTQLEERPRFVENVYNIITLGIQGSGKTTLTRMWANPVWDPRTVQGTTMKSYSRIVSITRQRGPDEQQVLLGHTFSILDIGGEKSQAVVGRLYDPDMEFHAVLFVVDLAKGGTLDPQRIEEQLDEFCHPRFLSIFFDNDSVTASLRTVVLFINKSDVLAGLPAEVEAEARSHFQPLIDQLHKFEGIRLEVLVGSALVGQSTHSLFRHFVQKILPEDAYDKTWTED